VAGKHITQQIDFKPFLHRIDQDKGLKNCRVVYFDGQAMTVIRAGAKNAGNDDLAVVIKPDLGPEVQVSALGAQARESKLYSELLGGVLSCGSAAVGWVVVFTGAVATPVTGGASSFLTVLGYVAASASTVQCGNAAVRVYNEVKDPQANDDLDSDAWYSNTILVMDVLSVANAFAGATGVARTLIRMKRAGGKPWLELLKGLSRADRRRLVEEIIRAKNPGISNSQLKMLVRSGQYPVRFSGAQISAAMRIALLEATGALTDVSGSSREGGVLFKAGGWVIGIARRVETL
jgi:hypothetical protein